MATKANVTEMQRSEIPLVYQIQRTKGPSAAELKAIHETSEAKLKEFRDVIAQQPKNPVQQFMDLVFTGSPTFNPATSSATALVVEAPGVASSWRLIAPPYEDDPTFNSMDKNGSVFASKEWGQMQTYATATDQQITELVVSISSPTQTSVSISPVGTYVAGFNFLTPNNEVSAEVDFTLSVYQDRTFVDGHTVIVFERHGSFAPGYKLYSGDIVDLANPSGGSLCPLSWKMTPNAKYHVVLKIASYLTCNPHSVVMTAGVAVPYFFVKTFS